MNYPFKEHFVIIIMFQIYFLSSVEHKRRYFMNFMKRDKHSYGFETICVNTFFFFFGWTVFELVFNEKSTNSHLQVVTTIEK